MVDDEDKYRSVTRSYHDPDDAGSGMAVDKGSKDSRQLESAKRSVQKKIIQNGNNQEEGGAQRDSKGPVIGENGTSSLLSPTAHQNKGKYPSPFKQPCVLPQMLIQNPKYANQAPAAKPESDQPDQHSQLISKINCNVGNTRSPQVRPGMMMAQGGKSGIINSSMRNNQTLGGPQLPPDKSAEQEEL